MLQHYSVLDCIYDIARKMSVTAVANTYYFHDLTAIFQYFVVFQ